MKGKVKVSNNETCIDIAKKHLLDERTLLAHLNTFDNALWFIILYIFSVVKFSYKDIDRGFFLRGRIKLREEETAEFRKKIIQEAEALLKETDEGKKIQESYFKFHDEIDKQMNWKVNPPKKIGGTRKRRMRGRATK